MSITLDLPENIVADLKKATAARDDASAVEIAVEDFLRRESANELIEAAGTIEMSDAWKFYNQIETVKPSNES